MQTSAHEFMLDQLQQTYSTTTGGPAHAAGDDSRLDAMAHLYTALREMLPTASLEHIARVLVEETRQALAMDLCALLLSAGGNSDDGHLTMQAASPDLNGQLLAVPPLRIEPTLREKLLTTPGHLPALSVDERDQLNPLKNVQYESMYIVPLVAGAECAGLLYCYSSKPRDLEQDEQLILQTIGSFAAMSIINRRLLDAAQATVSVGSFFDDLLRSDTELEDSLRGRAAALGCDCSQPHVMLVLEVAHVTREGASTEAGGQQQAAYRHAFKLIEQSVQASYPHSLFDAREHCLYALVALAQHGGIENLKKQLDALLPQLEGDMGVCLFAGLGNPCSDLHDYAAGFGEAQEALAVARCLNERAASLSFADLGAHRYLYPFARDHARPDLYLEQVAAIARYDQLHKRAGMLNTLEIYLQHWGNIKEVSERLGVHRNTITQRLERIQSLCTLDLEHPANRLPLHMAILIHKLRAR
jgi:sugar diacid utilization regulator